MQTKNWYNGALQYSRRSKVALDTTRAYISTILLRDITYAFGMHTSYSMHTPTLVHFLNNLILLRAY